MPSDPQVDAPEEGIADTFTRRVPYSTTTVRRCVTGRLERRSRPGTVLHPLVRSLRNG
jgi:hypothetical protein